MDEYYKDHFSNYSFSMICYYKLCEDGRLYRLDTDYRQWLEVGNLKFSTEWEQITEDCITESLLRSYISSFMYTGFEKIDPDKDPDYNPDKERSTTFEFFKHNNHVVARSSNGNEYLCLFYSMEPIGRKVINDEWEHLESCNVIKEIDSANKTIKFKDMGLLLDSLGNVHCYYEQNHLHINMNDGEVSFMELYTSSGGSKTSCSYEDLCKKNKNIPSEISIKDIMNLKTLYFKFESSQNCFEEKYPEGFGSEFEYFKNDSGAVYAKSDVGNEFIVLDSICRPVEKGTIKENWIREPGSRVVEDVIEYCYKYDRDRGWNPSIFGLDLFFNSKNELCGISYTGEKFKLDNVTGDFSFCENENDDDFCPDGVRQPVSSIKECIKYCARIKNEYNISLRTEEWKKYAIEKGARPFNVIKKFFITNLEEKSGFYAIDDNNQEYKCTLNSLDPVKKGTIEDSFVECDREKILCYLKLEDTEKTGLYSLCRSIFGTKKE